MEKFLRNELVSFTTKDGLILHGLLARPGSKVDSAMIYLHGLEGTFYRSNSMKVLARSATRKGIALLSIENREAILPWASGEKTAGIRDGCPPVGDLRGSRTAYMT